MCFVNFPSPAGTVRTGGSLSATCSALRKLLSSAVSASGAAGGTKTTGVPESVRVGGVSGRVSLRNRS